MNKFISVLMPAYNAEPYIEKAIQSILNQTYSNFELLISDDASSDHTLSVILGFVDNRIKVIQQSVNLGYAKNMTALLKAAKGDYLVIQDADDYALPERLSVLGTYLEQHSQVDVVGSSYVKFNEVSQEELHSAITDVGVIKQQFDAMQDPLPVLNGTLMLRREIIDNEILFRDLKYVNRGQDDDWLYRISEKYTFANVAEPLYYYRSNSSSMTLNPALITYRSIFAGDFVRFLKKKRKTNGIDLLDAQSWNEIEYFFEAQKKELLRKDPAYIESYIAHQYLAIKDSFNALKWLVKAVQKQPTRLFFWKKMVYVLFNVGN